MYDKIHYKLKKKKEKKMTKKKIKDRERMGSIAYLKQTCLLSALHFFLPNFPHFAKLDHCITLVLILTPDFMRYITLHSWCEKKM